MLKLIFDELKMFGAVIREIDENWLGKNSDLVVLYNIIQGRLFLNML